MPQFQEWRKIGPVLPCRGAECEAWDQEPTAPQVLQVGDELRMYYHGRRRGPEDANREVEQRIGAASASVDDPLQWRKWPDNPILTPDAGGELDSYCVYYPWVVPIEGDHWHMYYVGWAGAYWDHVPRKRAKKWHGLLAESHDGGRTFQRTGETVLMPGAAGACDEHGSGSCCVRRVGDEHWMWYTAVSWPVADWYQISVGLAISRDGGHHFEQHPASPVVNLPPRLGCERRGSVCSKPCVVIEEGRVRMWYSCAQDTTYRIHYAESADGIHFRWHPDPVLDVSPEGWDSEVVCYPSIVTLADRMLMFYCGNKNHGVGVAESLAAR